MQSKERRVSASRADSVTTRGLNNSQLATLHGVERFGWDLKFVRRTIFQQPIAIVFDPDRRAFAVLETDGTLNEHPGFDIRK